MSGSRHHVLSFGSTYALVAPMLSASCLRLYISCAASPPYSLSAPLHAHACPAHIRHLPRDVLTSLRARHVPCRRQARKHLRQHRSPRTLAHIPRPAPARSCLARARLSSRPRSSHILCLWLARAPSVFARHVYCPLSTVPHRVFARAMSPACLYLTYVCGTLYLISVR